MRTNASRWDPVLVGLVQDRGVTAQKESGLCVFSDSKKADPRSETTKPPKKK